ncbi:MAG: hypothetical protein HC836_18365 [Richelia sp. RM2_1_2]|nr:hypothetical protein [Richelia sp. SM2_1_7]NJO28359.1 hypothetical protein [Richelia sp. SL_2_1]NJO60156.1 hypothetical protein [Richelia sp. RM2_1_2]
MNQHAQTILNGNGLLAMANWIMDISALQKALNPSSDFYTITMIILQYRVSDIS